MVQKRRVNLSWGQDKDTDRPVQTKATACATRRVAEAGS